ncbi:hotdog fold thioesterase [Bdellovibrio bacteriovorus]|uniref:hotdog fold thioesterase n=1 Tax=Bdellovibrio bacteriovorus TaxID=959 RepID=UPI0035A74014
MEIQRKKATVDELNALSKNTMLETLGIRITKVEDGLLEGTMPVDHRTHQPYGILHGGASVVLAESLGSIAAQLYAPEGHFCVGLDINANHIRSVRSGTVTGRATPIHLGRTTQVWEIKITSEDDKLVCISRLTIAVVQKVK